MKHIYINNLIIMVSLLYVVPPGLITGWWFGTCFLFPYWECHHPNWLSRILGIPPTRSLLWLITINHQPGLHFPKFSPFFHLFKQRLHGGTIEVEETSFHPSSPCCEAVLVLLDFAYQLGGSVMTWKGDHERGLEPVKPSSNEKHGIFPVIYGLGTTYILFYNIYYTIIYNIWHIYIYMYV